MRILVTNDDGIDSLGLHHLARALAPLGHICVVAPDREFSGAGAAIGALHELKPEVHEVALDGVDEAWAVTGPPALCVLFARLGAFGPAPDLVVSGINPGANVGRSVYHSGTVGAALTARTGGITGIAVSQDAEFGVEGQAYEEVLGAQRWEVAAAVGAEVVAAILDDPPAEPGVLNVNVPNLPLDEIAGCRWTGVATAPPHPVARVVLEPKAGHQGSYHVKMAWGDQRDVGPGWDTGAVTQGYVSLTWLTRLEAAEPQPDGAARRLQALLAPVPAPGGGAR